MFRLIINNEPVDVNQDAYFEVVKGTIIGKSPALIEKEYSTEIELPSTFKNVALFQAHVLMGGSENILKGIAYFNTRSMLVDVQLVSFDNDVITIYISKRHEWLEILKNDTLAKFYSGLNYYYPNGILTIMGVLNTMGEGSIGIGFPYSGNYVNYTGRKGADRLFPILPSRNVYVVGEAEAVHTVYSEQPYVSMITITNNTETQSVSKLYYKIEIADCKVRIVLKISGVTVKTSIWHDKRGTSGTVTETWEISNLADDDLLEMGVEYDFILGNSNMNAITRTTCIVGFTGTLKQLPDSYDYDENYGNHTISISKRVKLVFPDIPMLDFLKAVANEAGQYLAIGTHNITGKPALIFKDFASYSYGGINNDLSNYYKSVNSVEITQPLPAKSNIIRYADDKNGGYDYILLNSPINLLFNQLPEVGEYIKFPIRRGSWLDNPEQGAVTVSGGDGLAESLGRWQIYSDTFKNPRLFKIKFRDLESVPTGVFYVKQLNGMFIASQIIESTKSEMMVEAYKLHDIDLK